MRLRELTDLVEISRIFRLELGVGDFQSHESLRQKLAELNEPEFSLFSSRLDHIVRVVEGMKDTLDISLHPHQES